MLPQTKRLKRALKRHHIDTRCRVEYSNGGYGPAYAYVNLSDTMQKLLALDSDLHIDPMYLNHKINKPFSSGLYFTRIES